MNVRARDVATFAACTWAVVVGFFYLDVGLPLRPFVALGLLLTLASIVMSVRSRDRMAAGLSVVSVGAIVLVVVVALLIASGGGWDR